MEELREKYATGEMVKTSGGLDESWSRRRYDVEKLWAYRPLRKVEVPEGAHPVDFFIQRKLDEAGLEAAPEADATQMIRRLSFGLTGLPPKPREVAGVCESL